MDNTSDTVSESFDFTDEEIRDELSRLGYNNIREEQFEEFKKDLMALVQVEKSDSFNSSSSSREYRNAASYGNMQSQLPSRLHTYQAAGKENDIMNSYYPVVDRSLRQPFALKSNTAHLSEISSSELRKPSFYYTADRDTDRQHPQTSVSEYYEPITFSPVRSQSTRHKVDRQTDESYESDANFQTANDATSSSLYDSRLSKEEADRVGHIDDQLDQKLNISKSSSILKRKVSRKMVNGDSRVYEESYVKDEAGDASDPESCYSDPGPVRTRIIPPEHSREPVVKFSDRPQSARYDRTVDPILSSVIWPTTKPKVFQKIDPVNRFQQYQEEWRKSKVPEEKLHKNLRWAIREQMLYKDVIYEKPQKKFVENKYVVPTDKKRKDLRWRIRADMAAGVMPTGL